MINWQGLYGNLSHMKRLKSILCLFFLFVYQLSPVSAKLLLQSVESPSSPRELERMPDQSDVIQIPKGNDKGGR